MMTDNPYKIIIQWWKLNLLQKKNDYIKSKWTASARLDYIETPEIIHMQWLVSKAHDWEQGMDILFFGMQKRDFEEELNSRIQIARQNYEHGSQAKSFEKKNI